MTTRPNGMRTLGGWLVAALAAACSTSGDVTGPVATGAWGGVGVALVADATGATLELDCARGTVSDPLRANRQGGFSLPGTFVLEHGGPVREDEVLESEPARYAGVLVGDAMTLSIHLEESGLVVGPFSLLRGEPPTLRKCL